MENLDSFAVVVEQQSLNRASRLLNLSQPALSRKMMRLGEDLGVRLFERNGRRLTLTAAGRICYEYATKAKELETEYMRKLASFRSGDVPGSITIGASLTTLQWTLPELVALYAKDFPKTDMLAITGKTHEIVTLVKEKRADIGLVASKVDQPGLHCVPLFDDHLSLVLQTGHPRAERTEWTIADMDVLPMILFSKGTWYRILTDELFRHYSIIPDVKMEIDSFEAIIRLVSTLGVATLLPMSYLRRSLLETNELIARDIPELQQTKRTTALLFDGDASRNASLHAFIWKAKEHFMREPE